MYWLNKESVEFLRQGYIYDDETPEQRIRDIAEHAQRILGIDGFADKFYDYMSRGFFSLSSPVWANFGRQRGCPISCITGDSWVNTKVGGGKQAKDISAGDEVLTHKGRYRKVTDVMITENRSNIYRLKVKTRNTPLYITENHLVLTNLGWVRVDELRKDTHLVAINREIDLKEENAQIDLSDFIVESLPTQFQSKPIEPIHTFDEELAWAFGLWFAEGSLSTNKGKPNGLRVTMAEDELHYAEKWLEIMSRRFGVHGNSYVSETSRWQGGAKWCNAYINSTTLGRFFESFGKGCKVKELPQWLIESPKNVLSSFFEAILIGDGSEKKSGNNRITLANPKLVLQLYQIALKLGYDVSLQMTEKAGKLATTKYVYTLNILRYHRQSERNRMETIKFNDGLSYAVITELTLTDKTETVYDFTVEEDHSFSVGGIVVHNCFGSYCGDSISEILDTASEVGLMTKMGGGTSAYFGDVRCAGSPITGGGESEGVTPFLRIYESVVNVCKQSDVRRGSFAAYLPIDHGDIREFLKIRTRGNPIQHIFPAVTVPDYWMREMIDGDPEKREIWAEVIKARTEAGTPYVMFTDNCQKNRPECYSDRSIRSSNLCSEIALPVQGDESFVCCLSSINLLHWEDIEQTDAIEVLTFFLDAVMTEFIKKSEGHRELERARRFAIRHRALGLGVLGWHSYLQSKMIAFEDMAAKYQTHRIFSKLRNDTYEASRKLAEMFGPSEIAASEGRRNTTLMAIAPTKSSSFILGQVSQSTEPEFSNYHVKNRAKIRYSHKNPYLENLLIHLDQNTDEVWESILLNDGSVQHLDFLTDHQKDVFKTFSEISQKEVVIQAAIRQKYIDQGQSLNLMIHPDTPVKDINKLMIFAWEQGVKTLYYQHSINAAQALFRDINSCRSCEA